MKIQILSLFPEICRAALGESMMKRAQEKGFATLEALNIRDWAPGKHHVTDEAPYGGGPGMVMKIEPIYQALEAIRTPGAKVILMTPQGKKFTQSMAESFAKESHLIVLCGHYEGVDQRVADYLVDEEISIGDYVLTNGAISAVVFVDAIVRLIPGVLGDDQSAVSESFSTGQLDYPHYTRPERFQGWSVPPILLSGNHGAIEKWRQAEALRLTEERRPDLLS